MLVLTKITDCRDGQLIWLAGRFEMAAFSGQTDRFICWYWVHCARCTLQDNERRGTEKTQRLSSQVPKRRVIRGRVVNGPHFEARARNHKHKSGPSPTFIFEARYRPESHLYQVSQGMGNCTISKM